MAFVKSGMDVSWQTSRLSAKQKCVTSRKIDLVIARAGKFRDRKDPWVVQAVKTVIQCVMLLDTRHIVIVQTGTAAGFFIQRKPQWPDQMQPGTCVRTQSDDIAGVWRDLGGKQQDVEHVSAHQDMKIQVRRRLA